VSIGAVGFNNTAAERIVMNESLKSTTCFLASVAATAPAAMSRSYNAQHSVQRRLNNSLLSVAVLQKVGTEKYYKYA